MRARLRIPRVGALLAAGYVAACTPSVQVTRLAEIQPPRPGLEEVAVYSTQVPRCDYQEMAVLTGYGSALGPNDLEGVLVVLRKRALDIGADALVGLQVVSRGGESPRSGYSATAVRFQDAGCRTMTDGGG